MKVVLVSPLPPKRDGVATYTADLAAAYRADGHEVCFVADAPGSTMPDVVAVLPRTPAGVRAVARRVADLRPDLVHVQHAIATYGPQLAALLAFVALLRRRDLTVVVTHHEVTRDTDRLRLPGRVYYGLVSRIAGRVHVHTPAAAERLARCGVSPGSVVVHPHPVFVPEVSDDPDVADRLRDRFASDRAHLAVLIGYIQVEKGHLETVEAYADLLARRPDLRGEVRLVIAGEVRSRPAGFTQFERADREYASCVRALVARHGLDDVVRWAGHVPAEEFDAWFRAADLVLLPYRAAEESGIAGHAVVADCPVLAAPVGGLSVLFGGTALALPGTDPTTFSASLEHAIDEPETLRREAQQVHAGLRERRGARGLVGAVTAMTGPVPSGEGVR